RAHGLPPRRARRAAPHAPRGRRRVAARVSEPPLRSPLRSLALGGTSSEGEGVPLGASAQARGGDPGEEGTQMKHPIWFKQLEVGPMQNYVYLLGDPTTKDAAVVDAAWDIDAILKVAEAEGYTVTKNLVTHFHPDHLGGDLMGHNIRGAAELAAK